MMKAMIPTHSARMMTTAHHCMVPLWRPEMMEVSALKPEETMPTRRMMEMPLPMPFSVIWSPSHMTTMEPATKVAMMTMALQVPVRVRTVPKLFSMR